MTTTDYGEDGIRPPTETVRDVLIPAGIPFHNHDPFESDLERAMAASRAAFHDHERQRRERAHRLRLLVDRYRSSLLLPLRTKLSWWIRFPESPDDLDTLRSVRQWVDLFLQEPSIDLDRVDDDPTSLRRLHHAIPSCNTHDTLLTTFRQFLDEWLYPRTADLTR